MMAIPSKTPVLFFKARVRNLRTLAFLKDIFATGFVGSWMRESVQLGLYHTARERGIALLLGIFVQSRSCKS